MYELRHINAQNIISFGDLNLDIDSGVATAIIGENRDDQSQKVNGSGKSAIIEAIAIGLTGEPLRKVKTDEFISDWAGDACVELLLHNTFTNKDFFISRRFGRKQPQEIECHLYDCTTGEDVEQDKTSQASVNDYNKFIMSEIGISKEDLFNYYILSSKYESFFEASDRNKKELINRFSNGVLVDQSIEKLDENLVPFENDVVSANNNVIAITSRIDAVVRELSTASQRKEEAKNSKEQKIAQYNQYISDKRKCIREHNDLIAKAEDRLTKLKELPGALQNIQTLNLSLKESYEKLCDLFKENSLDVSTNVITDSIEYSNELSKLQKDFDEYKKNLEICQKDFDTKGEHYDKLSLEHQKLEEQHEELCAKLDKVDKECNAQLDKFDEKLNALDSDIKDANKKKESVERKIGSLKNLLAGVIECPNCHHRFSLATDKSVEELNSEVKSYEDEVSDIDKSVDDINFDKKRIEKEYDSLQDKLDELDKERKDSKAGLDASYESVKKAGKEVDTSDSALKSVNRNIADIESRVKIIERSIFGLMDEMFRNANSTIETAINNGNNFVKTQDESIASLEGSIKAYQDSIKALEEASSDDFEESLKISKEKYEKELEGASLKLKEVTAKRDELKEQRQTFLSFKAHLANTKLDAISQIVNNVLEEIGSNIRVDLQGYKKLRTGKLKESITVHLLKDGVECGSFYKFSAGERCRVNLASIIALQRLTNANCEDGKGLGLLVFDEILDSSDQVGFMSYCNMINNLQITSLLITQNSLPENYPYSLTVVKENGMSNILNNQ